jgi:hypothetical protein
VNAVVRLQAASGAAGIAVVAVGLALAGAPPRTSEPVADITRTLVDHRAAFLAGNYVIAIGALLLLLFLGVLRTRLGAGGERSLANAAAGAAYVAVALLMTGTATIGGLAFSGGMRDPAVVRALIDVGNAQIEMAGIAFAGLLLAGSACGALPRALRVLGYAGAAYLVVTRLALAADSGPFEAGNALDLSGTLPAVAWIAGASVVLTRAPLPNGAGTTKR